MANQAAGQERRRSRSQDGTLAPARECGASRRSWTRGQSDVVSGAALAVTIREQDVPAMSEYRVRFLFLLAHSRARGEI